MSGFLKGPWWEEGLRALFALPTGGLSETVGRDNQLGRTTTGGLEGGVGGFLTGGPIGAIMGAGTGMGLSGTGTTDPYSWKGGGINFGSGVGSGGLTHLPALLAAHGAPASISSMVPYTPTSAPNMGAAGSTLGAGGMGSPLSLGSGGAGDVVGSGAGAGAGAGGSQTSQILRAMRLGKLFGGNQKQQQPAMPNSQRLDKLKALYTMFPELNPGLNQGTGGQYGV